MVLSTATRARVWCVFRHIKCNLIYNKTYNFHQFNRNMSYISLSPPVSPSTPRSGVPLPEHKAITLSAVSSLLAPPGYGTPMQFVTPIHSPCCSPPPTIPSSGYLEEAKASLKRAALQRNAKTSTLTIDEDMRDMCCYYRLLGTDERNVFLEHLATQYSIDHTALEGIIASKPPSTQRAGTIRWEDKLRAALQPPHCWVFSQISRLTGGVKFLVDLRLNLLVLLGSDLQLEEESVVALKQLDASLREMLSLWFTVGLLQLARITWDSSCSMLQKISEYEAVHPVRNWTDLKRRVGQYRRCFVFTHSCMPNEPLVVLHTFLTTEISKSMAGIVQNPRFNDIADDATDVLQEEENTSAITTVIFYSITSTQKGLQGIELGNYLIKRVVKELQAELPQLSQFSSLSPIPAFVKWLHSALAKASRGEIRIFTDDEMKSLIRLLVPPSTLDAPAERNRSPSDDVEVTLTPNFLANDAKDKSLVYQRLRQLFNTNGWSEDERLKQCLETPLMRLCAHYLYSEKRRSYALDSVAHFHLKNGAVMWRINWDADPSPRGLSNSCGIMVNYRYFLSDNEQNSREYQETMKINAAESVVRLAEAAAEVISGGVVPSHM